jgi:hypothetical protein
MTSKSERMAPTMANRIPNDPTPVGHRQTDLASLLSDLQPSTLSGGIYEISDAELPLVMEAIDAQEDPQAKAALLVTVYEDTRLRPPLIRLPLLLEIARESAAPSGLRDTIMAELGAVLHADHGSSWPDWALAMEEHLARTEGLLRVD